MSSTKYVTELKVGDVFNTGTGNAVWQTVREILTGLSSGVVIVVTEWTSYRFDPMVGVEVFE